MRRIAPIAVAASSLGVALLLACDRTMQAPSPPGEVTQQVERRPTDPLASPQKTPAPGELYQNTMAELEALKGRPDSDAKRTRLDELRSQAKAALRVLPDDDPRALSILCKAANGPWDLGKASIIWARAAALDARRSISEGPARYASLLQDTVRLGGRYRWASYDTLLTSHLERLRAPVAYHALTWDTCEQLDHAAIRLRFAFYVGPSDVALADLYAEVARDLGPNNAALATVLDHGHMLCPGPTNTPACPSERRRFERSLELRERGLGIDHPLTRTSRVNLAVILLSEGAQQRARALLEAVEQSHAVDITTVLALRELGWLDVRRKKWRHAEIRLCEASRIFERLPAPRPFGDLADELLGDCGHALAYAGYYDEALEMFQRARARSPRGQDPRSYSFQIAEVLRLKGDFKEALEHYDRLLVAWKDEYWLTDAAKWIARAHRGRAAALMGMRRKDLESARAWEERHR